MLFASVALVGCDTTDDEGDVEDAARFLGEWTVVEARDQDGDRDQTEVLSALGTLTIDLNADGAYSIEFLFTDPQIEDAVISETYTVDEVASDLILVVQIPGLPPQDLPLDYSFSNDSEVELTIEGTLLGFLLGQGQDIDIEFEGNVILVAQKQ
ncbi:MAG: hypothetical protein AB8G77_02555 [Rhodothermales bacterium]